jgi:hypothetical protein
VSLRRQAWAGGVPFAVIWIWALPLPPDLSFICETLRALRAAVTLVANLVEVADLVYWVEDGRIALVRGELAVPARDVARG